jgi:hypothetical protein
MRRPNRVTNAKAGGNSNRHVLSFVLNDHLQTESGNSESASDHRSPQSIGDENGAN